MKWNLRDPRHVLKGPITLPDDDERPTEVVVKGYEKYKQKKSEWKSNFVIIVFLMKVCVWVCVFIVSVCEFSETTATAPLFGEDLEGVIKQNNRLK